MTLFIFLGKGSYDVNAFNEAAYESAPIKP
jgi:hypothetical protein